MKKPNMKVYTIKFTANSEKDERMFEQVLEHWRKDKELILIWEKSLVLKAKYGDQE